MIIGMTRRSSFRDSRTLIRLLLRHILPLDRGRPCAQPTDPIELRSAVIARMPTDTTLTRALLDEPATRDLISELARQIDQAVHSEAHLVLVGIRRRGDSIADRIGEHLRTIRSELSVGSLDITLYRDDFGQVDFLPVVGPTTIEGSIDGAHVVVVDDVLYTGRTIRAALNELADFGKANKIELCVLVDRGGRQLPIQPDYVGHHVEVAPGQEVSVRVAALDGAWGVDLVERSTVLADSGEVSER